MVHLNWGGNYQYHSSEVAVPGSVEQLQELTVRSTKLKALGTRHSFNGIADTTAIQVSLERLNRVIHLDRERLLVKVEGGIRYGDLCSYLHEQGYALQNLASLPHISVAGAVATGTHGSGVRNGSLSTSVHALEIVTADGSLIELCRDDAAGDFAGSVVALGGLGIVTAITLNVVPAFDVRQYVYEGLKLHGLEEHLEEIFSCAYSVSLFTDWKAAAFHQVWVKRTEGAEFSPPAELYGALAARTPLHPVPGHGAEHCTEQLGICGPWHERLPHFRMGFTPSSGEELQSEYFMPRARAFEALCAVEKLRADIAPLLYASEVRTVAADDLWMSPCYGRDSVAIHFTWKPDEAAVRRLLPRIEEALAPYEARPHWGKVFTMPPDQVKALYEKHTEFRNLLLRWDPQGKFRNEYLSTYIY